MNLTVTDINGKTTVYKNITRFNSDDTGLSFVRPIAGSIPKEENLSIDTIGNFVVSK